MLGDPLAAQRLARARQRRPVPSTQGHLAAQK